MDEVKEQIKMSDKQTDKKWKSDWMDSRAIKHLVWSAPNRRRGAGEARLLQTDAVSIFHTILTKGF